MPRAKAFILENKEKFIAFEDSGITHKNFANKIKQFHSLIFKFLKNLSNCGCKKSAERLKKSDKKKADFSS